MSNGNPFTSAIKVIPDLLAWLLSPMRAPWEQDVPTNVVPTIASAVPGVALMYPCLRLANDQLLLKQASNQFLSLFLALSPLIVALLLCPIRAGLTYIQILRTCGWLYRNFALNVLLVILWAMALNQKPQQNLGLKLYANFYAAVYGSAIALLILNTVSLIAAGETGKTILASSLVYLAFLSFVLFVCPIFVPDFTYGPWWNPAT